MSYSSDYPVTNSVTYEFTTKYSTTIRYTAYDGNFDTVRSWTDVAADQVVHDDDHIEFWQAVVHYYLETTPGSPCYNNNDLFRAAQACKLIGVCPEFEDLDRIIGFGSAHNSEPDHWGLVRLRANDYMEEHDIEPR